MNRALRSLAVAGLLLAAGCSTHGRFPVQTGTETVLTSNNFRVVKTALKGEDSGFSVFGVGAEAKFATCLDKIRASAQLDERARALVNVTYDESWWTIGIVGGDHIVVTADVVEFVGPPTGSQ